MRCLTRVMFRLFSFLLLLSILFFTVPSRILAEEIIRINGTGSGLEMVKPLVAAYAKEAPGVSIKIEKPLGSSGGIKALLAGAIDIAVTSKPLTPEETAQGAKLRIFGKTPVVIVTEKRIPVKNISTRELEDIYAGNKKKWPHGETIRIILRPNEEIDTKILKGLSPGMAGAMDKAHHRRGLIVAMTNPESNEAVSKTPGGIGLGSLPCVLVGKQPLNVLMLDGVVPGTKTLANKTYPLSKNIDFVINGNLSFAAAKFLDFVYSKKGRAIAEKTGILITVAGK